MTPYEIILLLKIYAEAGPHQRSEHRLQGETIDSFMHHGLINGPANDLRITEREARHISQLCSTAWPIQEVRWVNSHGETIDSI